MAFDSDLLAGVAALLAAEGCGTWNPSGVYTPDQTAIVIDAVPETLPRLIVLSTYAVADDPGMSGDVVGLQVLTRWDGANPIGVRDLDSLIFDRLQGRSGVTLPTGIRVVLFARRSGASLGQDDSRRWSRTSNYYLTVHRPTSHRL